MNRKIEKRIVWYLLGFLTFISIISLIPMLKYYCNFKSNEVSTKVSDWGAYGDYLSGTIGVLLSFFATTLSLISIYLTVRITKKIQENEFAHNERINNDNLKLTYLQNKPLPYFNLNKLPNETKIELQNMGTGSLIVNKIFVEYGDAENFRTYNNFRDIFQDEKLSYNESITKFTVNTAPTYILSSDKSKTLLELRPINEKEINNDFKSLNRTCLQILGKCKIVIECEDIFGRTFTEEKTLSFFAN